MTSIREQIVKRVMESISSIPAPGRDGVVPVYRDSDEAISRSEVCAYTVDWTKEDVRSLTSAQDECELMIVLGAILRTHERDDAALDHMIAAAHAAVMADRRLGGLCQAIYRRTAGRQTNHEDLINSEIRHGYIVVYRHQAAAMDV